LRRLGRAEVLFQAGDARVQLYRVERGALCTTSAGRTASPDHRVRVPGDIIGFGHLATPHEYGAGRDRLILGPVSAEELISAREKLTANLPRGLLPRLIASSIIFAAARSRAVVASRCAGCLVPRALSHVSR
jgi:hypothetical protein